MSGALVVHASGAARREAALTFAREGSGPLVVATARIETARALAADLALALGSVVDVESTTLDGLAARLARPALRAAGQTIATTLALDTAAAQAIHALATTLPRMGPLRATPGLPRAITRTLDELWAADLAAGNVAPFDAELAAVLAHVERALATEKLVPRARVTEMAIAAVQGGALRGTRVVLLDVPIRTRLASELARAIATGAASARFVVPSADARTLGHLGEIPVTEARASHAEVAELADALFSSRREKTYAGVLETVLARGEAAEAAEIARRVLAAAREGTPLHRIAIALRKPELSRAALEAAFRGAGITLAQRRGARRPDPSGRALLALLTCASEGLSARAFAAYLSFGVLPDTLDGAPPAASANAAVRAYDDEEDGDEGENDPVPDPVRAPRRWETLLSEAAVIGGDPTRWKRRLDGLAEELRRKADEVDRTGGESHGLRRTLDELSALARFALPLIEDLAALPPRASPATYAERVAAIASRALRHPTRALTVLAELAPRASSGQELTLADLVRVLGPRLGALETRPPTAGVSVVTPDELRGATFDTVILAGLAERTFPARVPEDPLLPDEARHALSPDLEDAHARAQNERLLLAIAVGAAERRVIATASITTAEGRPRVPSVYFVELLGRRLGRVASGADVASAMERAASVVGSAEAAARPSERAIARVRDLSRLSRDDARGRANDVVERNALLRSALLRAWRREMDRLGPADGLVQGKSHARAPLLAHLPSKRPFSATALESFAACPLRFHLKAVLRLEPREEPTRLEELDPMTRGSITHEAQFLTLLALREQGALPLAPERQEEARATLGRIFAQLRRDLVERLVPAIPRVFHAELDAIEADLREWLARVAADTAWTPRYFELAFGLAGQAADRDPASRPDPLPLDEGIQLRGAIDLVEESAASGALRATDHKTGSSYAIRGGAVVVRGGQTLQPVLYALALEKLFPGKKVLGGRLWYCSSRAGFVDATVPLDDEARAAVRELAEAVTQAMQKGLLPALPVAGACNFCDYALACGPTAEARAHHVPSETVGQSLPGLVALRKRR